jgi:hypothetical protein
MGFDRQAYAKSCEIREVKKCFKISNHRHLGHTVISCSGEILISFGDRQLKIRLLRTAGGARFVPITFNQRESRWRVGRSHGCRVCLEDVEKAPFYASLCLRIMAVGWNRRMGGVLRNPSFDVNRPGCDGFRKTPPILRSESMLVGLSGTLIKNFNVEESERNPTTRTPEYIGNLFVGRRIVGFRLVPRDLHVSR